MPYLFARVDPEAYFVKYVGQIRLGVINIGSLGKFVPKTYRISNDKFLTFDRANRRPDFWWTWFYKLRTFGLQIGIFINTFYRNLKYNEVNTSRTGPDSITIDCSKPTKRRTWVKVN